MWAAWLALGCYLIILVGVAIWARRGRNTDDDSYFLADRSLAWPMLLVTMAATNFSAFTVYGSSGAGYRVGLSFLPIMAFGTGFMAVALYAIGRRVRRLSIEHNAMTAPEIIGAQTGSIGAQRTMAAILVLATIPYLALQPRAAGIVISALFGGPEWLGAVLVTIIVILYTLSGGLEAVVRTDLVQGIIAMSLLWLGLILVLNDSGGPSKAFASLAVVDPVLMGRVDKYILIVWSSTLLLWLLADPMFPQLFQRLCAAESDEAIGRMSALYPVVATLAFLPPIIIGLLGHLDNHGLDKAASDGILPTMVIDVGGEWLGGLILIAGLAALMSTMDSQLLSTGSLVVRDLAPELDVDRHQRLRQASMIGLAILGLILSLWSNLSLLDLGLLSFCVYAVMFPAVWASLHSERLDGVAVIASIIAGEIVVGLALWQPSIFSGWWIEPVGPAIPAAVIPAVVVAILTLFTVQILRENVDSIISIIHRAMPSRNARWPVIGLAFIFILAHDWWWWGDRDAWLLGLPKWTWWFFLLSICQIWLMVYWMRAEDGLDSHISGNNTDSSE